MGNKRWGWWLVLSLSLGSILANAILLKSNVSVGHAAVTVSDYAGLKRELESSGQATVRLATSFSIQDTIYVRGEKHLEGGGHTLSRYGKASEIFGGTLLVVYGGSLTIRDVTISGGGAGKDIQKSIYGRLLDLGEGQVVLGTGTVLTRNVNQSQNNDGGGAVLVAQGGTLTMNGGTISGNQNVYGGAGVHIEDGGSFIMKGGIISDNRSDGIGAVEGFDGRGGAIFNRGKVTISGGSICRNRVKGYAKAGIRYGGVGGMLYNHGECQIQGGMIMGNHASYGGGAVYNDRTSNLRITGGTIRGNDADVGEGLFLAGGGCRLGGSVALSSIFLARGTTVRADDGLTHQGTGIVLVPETYKEGTYLVRKSENGSMSNKVFSLKKKGKYTLGFKKDGLYVTKEKVEKVPASGKGAKSKSADKGGTGAKPQDGETKKAGERQNREKNREKKGEKKGEKKEAEEEKAPTIRTAHRYFFVWEVSSYTEEEWRGVLLAGCRIWYGNRNREEVAFRWRWNGLLGNGAGNYRVEVSAERGDWTVIPVTIVRESTEDEYGGWTGYVRFQQVRTGTVASVGDGGMPAGTEDRADCGMVWHFGPEEIRAAKAFMRERQDPFSRETNQEFLKRFQGCQMREEDWGVR